MGSQAASINMHRSSDTTAHSYSIVVAPDTSPAYEPINSKRALRRSQIRRLVGLRYGSSCRSFDSHPRPDPLMSFTLATRHRMISSATDHTQDGHGWLPKRRSGRHHIAPTSGRAFRATMTALKEQVTSMKVRDDSIKGCRQDRTLVFLPGVIAAKSSPPQ
jgi:hypothetical protein